MRVGNVVVTTESVMAGATMFSRCGRRGVPIPARIDDLQRASGWLAEMHAATETRRYEACDVDQTGFMKFVTGYEAAFGFDEKERKLVDAALVHAASLRDVALPMVLQHRDFNPWNIVRNGDAIGVIDWEGAREGVALVDLLQLCTNWFDLVRGAHDEEKKLAHYAELLIEPVIGDSVVRGARDAIAAYLTRLGISPRAVPMLVLMSWLELAVRREDQRRAHGAAHAGSGGARSGNRALPFIALLAQERERLFSGSAWG